VSRSTHEILSTGPYTSDESVRLREEGFVWRRCDWCRVEAYTKKGLCRPCSKELR